MKRKSYRMNDATAATIAPHVPATTAVATTAARYTAEAFGAPAPCRRATATVAAASEGTATARSLARSRLLIPRIARSYVVSDGNGRQVDPMVAPAIGSHLSAMASAEAH